jgi:ribonucleoside-diphosphate reductase alpha subunit
MEIGKPQILKSAFLIKAGARNDFYSTFSEYQTSELTDKECLQILDRVKMKKRITYEFINKLDKDKDEALRTVIRNSGYLSDLKRLKYLDEKPLYPMTIKHMITPFQDDLQINVAELSDKVYQRLGMKNTPEEIMKMVIDVAESCIGLHFDYDKLCVKIMLDKIHNETHDDYVDLVEEMYFHYHRDIHKPLVSYQFYQFVIKHANIINGHINYDLDYLFDYMGLRTFIKSYMKHDCNDKLIERPQHVWMRTALAIHMIDGDIDAAMNTYFEMSNHYYTHASPTLFNAGTDKPQMSSCFLLGGGVNEKPAPTNFYESIEYYIYRTGEYLGNLSVGWAVIPILLTVFYPLYATILSVLSIGTVYHYRKESQKYYDDDSMEGIGELWKKCAIISKFSGGIGMSLHHIRAQGEYIAGTQGKASGLKMIHVLNSVCVYADQGGGKRPGAFAIYMEPWHADVEYFLNLKKPNNVDAARDLFYALWVPDLFMKRVQEEGMWSLMCPKQCPGLSDVYGEKFEELYVEYENRGLYKRQIPAKKLWDHIIELQQTSGTPYILFKDAINRKSNQKNLGTIKCSNLCAEIVEYSDPTEIAVCNLSSISLPKFVEEGEVDYASLMEVAYNLTLNLNKIIDSNFYPLPQMKKSNFRHRPIGIGIQGLHNVFMKLKLPFGSEEAMRVDREMMESIYYGALSASVDLARQHGAYSTFKGSPASKGLFQFDMWDEKPSDRWDWDGLRADMMYYGLRNSLVTTCMPTASTARFFGNVECFEPILSNAFSHETKAGHFQVYNKHLMEDMLERGLWDDQMRNELYSGKGSIQHCSRISSKDKELYKTAWEIPMKAVIEHARARAPFVDQTMSMNLFRETPHSGKQTKALFYAWELGLKTGQYYFRTQPRSQGENFAVQQSIQVCSRDNPNCETCSS